MSTHPDQTIVIIGGGVAGIAAARTLHEAEVPFTIVTTEWGGRVVTSADGHTNYGAYILPDTSRHIIQFANKGRRLHLFGIHFHNRVKSYTFLSAVLQREWELWRLIKAIALFQEEYLAFRDQCLGMPQDKALQQNPYLAELYATPAEDWIKTKRIENIVHEYIAEAVYMCTFTPLKHLNAFNLMQIAMYIDIPVFEFELDIASMTEPIVNSQVKASVTMINPHGDGYQLTLDNGQTVTASHVIMATEPTIGTSLLKLTHDRVAASAHMFHIRGKLQEKHEGAIEVYYDDSPTIFISRQEDGTHLYYSTTANPPLDDFFIEPEIIAHRYWNPAFLVGGHALVPMKYNNRLWLAGDYNVIGLENSYVSGVSAANQLLTSLNQP